MVFPCRLELVLNPTLDVDPSIPHVLSNSKSRRPVARVPPRVQRGNGDIEVVRQLLGRQQVARVVAVCRSIEK